MSQYAKSLALQEEAISPKTETLVKLGKTQIG